MDKKGENGKYLAFGLMIGALAGAAGVFVPFAAHLMPAFLAFVFAAWGAYGIVPALAGASAVTLAFLPPAEAGYLLALYVPAALIAGFFIRKKLPWRTAVVASAFAMGAAMYLNLCLPSMLAGSNPFAAFKEAIAETSRALLDEFGALAPRDEAALSLVREAFLTLRDIAPQIAMYIIAGASMFFSLVNVLIARALAKKAGAEMRPMAHFALWQLSEQYAYASLAAIAGVLAVMFIGLENADAVFALGTSVVVMPLMLTGICYVEFNIRMGGRNKQGRRVAFYIFAALLLPYSLIFLGLMDRITKARRNYTEKKKTGEN